MVGGQQMMYDALFPDEITDEAEYRDKEDHDVEHGV